MPIVDVLLLVACMLVVLGCLAAFHAVGHLLERGARSPARLPAARARTLRLPR